MDSHAAHKPISNKKELENTDQDPVIQQFEKTGIIVRTPSYYNPTRGEGWKENSLEYECTEALKDPRGKSACFLMKGSPFSPYGGNEFFFIYNPEKFDILLAILRDGSVDQTAVIKWSEKGKPKHFGLTDYSRYAKDKTFAHPTGTLTDLKYKMLRRNAKRTGQIKSNAALHRGFSTFGHNEVLIQIKEKEIPRNAIIGIGIYKDYLNSHDTIVRLKATKQKLKEIGLTLNCYTYDPFNGLELLDIEILENTETYYDKIFFQHLNFVNVKKYEYENKTFPSLIIEKKSGMPELEEKKWVTLYTLIQATKYYDKYQPLYQFKLSDLEMSQHSKPLCINYSRPNASHIKDLAHYVIQLNSATTIEQVNKINYSAIACVYLQWLFYSPGSFENIPKEFNPLANIHLNRSIDPQTGIPRFHFTQQIMYSSEPLYLSVGVEMRNGRVEIHGQIGDKNTKTDFCYRSDKILCYSSYYEGDAGAILWLEKKYIEKNMSLLNENIKFKTEDKVEIFIMRDEIHFSFKKDAGFNEFIDFIATNFNINTSGSR